MVSPRTVTCWPPPVCPQANAFTFYADGSEPQQLVIENDQTLLWNGKRAPTAGNRPAPRYSVYRFFLTRSAITPVSARYATLTQRNATLVYGQLPDEAAARLDAFSRVEQGLPLTAVEARFVFARTDTQPGPLPDFTTALVGMRNQYTYSPTERYEHIYLNDNFFTPGSVWMAWKKGLADVDRCHYVQGG